MMFMSYLSSWVFLFLTIWSDPSLLKVKLEVFYYAAEFFLLSNTTKLHGRFSIFDTNSVCLIVSMLIAYFHGLSTTLSFFSSGY